VLVIDLDDLSFQLLVAHRPCRRRRGLGGVGGGRGDLAAVLGEHPADRLDPEPVSNGRRRMPLAARLRVELPRKETRQRLQDLVRAAQAHGSPARADASTPAHRWPARSLTGVNLGPTSQRLEPPRILGGSRSRYHTGTVSGLPAGDTVESQAKRFVRNRLSTRSRLSAVSSDVSYMVARF
jgi:hypothetical protein